MPNSSPRSSTRAAALRARSLALPPARSIGIMPMAGNRNFVFQSSMYSALPTNVIRRGSTSGIMNESMTDVWFGHMIAGPSVGTFCKPSTCTRQPKRNNGVRTVLAIVYSCPYSRCSSATRRSLPDRPKSPSKSSVEDDAEQVSRLRHAEALADSTVDGRHCTRSVEVIVEGGAHLVQTALALAGCSPAVEALCGARHARVVPLPRGAVVVLHEHRADHRAVPLLAEIGHEHEVAERLR